MSKWVSQSNYVANNHTLLNDARHSANALRHDSTTTLIFTPVCAVMLLETEQANSALPTPDHQTTTILAKAYNNLGAGANVCYDAAAERGETRQGSSLLNPGRRSTLRSVGPYCERHVELVARRSQIDLESQDAVLQCGRGVTKHREVLEVDLGRFDEAQTLGSFDRGEAPTFHRLGAFTKAQNHLVGIKGLAHRQMLGALLRTRLGSMDTQLRLFWVVVAARYWPATSEELT